MASADLCWQIMRVQSCHIIKKPQCAKWFSSDPLNPKNVHVKKFSGLSQKKALTVAASPKGKGVVLVAKTKNFKLNRPSKSLQQIPLTKHMRRINKAINGEEHVTDTLPAQMILALS